MMHNNTVMKQKRHSSSERSEPHTRSLTLMSLIGSTNTCRRSWCEIKIEIIFRREGRVKEGGRDWAGARNLYFCCFVHFIFQSNMILREIYLKKKSTPILTLSRAALKLFKALSRRLLGSPLNWTCHSLHDLLLDFHQVV